jgi:hypothetical protein
MQNRMPFWGVKTNGLIRVPRSQAYIFHPAVVPCNTHDKEYFIQFMVLIS